MNALLQQALAYAGRGLRVFPLHYAVEHEGQLRCSCGNPHADNNNAAKHPYGPLAPNGLLNATSHIETIKRWWGVPYNIGIRTGAASDIVAIDIDPRHGGVEALAELERRFGALPLTWRFLTGGGGEHVLFRHPRRPVPNNAATKLGPGLDVRGDGGYIVAPPSLHISGRRYAISVDHQPDIVALAELPVWLTTMVAKPAKPNGPRVAAMPESWRRLVAEGVSEGCRNDAIARLAGHLLRKRVDPLVVLDLCRTWNSCRCRPPLTEAEIVGTVNSIAAREIGRRGARCE